jgi:quinol monooxygenase YgiN
MQAYLYRFNVKPGLEARFQSAWHNLTLLIREERGSLGSRLHLSAKKEFIAYAQWPSFEVAKTAHAASSGYQTAFAEMQSCLVSAEVLFELDMVDDLLS